MRILYLTPAWFGFREILFEGEVEIKGLPSFTRPLKRLIEKGHKVDFVIMHSSKAIREINIKASWLKKAQIKGFFFYNLKLPQKFLSISKYRNLIKKILETNDYDFVYAHGSSTALARSVVIDRGIPFGQRLYGTFLWNEINRLGYKKACIKHLVEYLSFRKGKSFLLVTNDGSRGDLVQKAICSKRCSYEFYYWVNGVERVEDISDEEVNRFRASLVSKEFLFYVARFDEWKRQDRAVKILHSLRERGNDIHLYLAGPPEEGNHWYFDHVMKIVSDLDLEDHVTYMGNISQRTITIMAKLALASLSLYDVCNLTNVFHELMAAGAIIIVRDDGSTKDFINHGDNGFYVQSDEEAVSIIEELLSSPQSIPSMRMSAIETSKKLVKSWDERVEMEIELIERYGNSDKLES